MKSIEEKFPAIYERVAKAHEGVHGGHDIWHAKRVATWAMEIAIDEWGDKHISELAGLAALCHNADRLKEHIYGRDKTPDNATEELILTWLNGSELSIEDAQTILQAVLRHSKKNDASDSEVQIALMDADRIVNLELDVVIRAGQFQPDLPAIDYVNFLTDPAANYRDPRSVLRDISHCLEWADPKVTAFCFRTKMGWEAGQERAWNLNRYFDVLKHQLKSGGLLQNT